MNKTFIFLPTFVFLMLLSCQAFANAQKPSEDMILILIHHKSGPHELEPQVLPLDKNKSAPTKAEMIEYEVYVVPYPDAPADICEFSVYLHRPSGRYWIHKWDCGAGLSEFYGPGEAKNLRK